MVARIEQWKAALRPAKRLQQAIKQDSDVSRTLKEATALLDRKDIWLDVTTVMSKGRHIEKKEMKLVVAAILTKLAFHGSGQELSYTLHWENFGRPEERRKVKMCTPCG